MVGRNAWKYLTHCTHSHDKKRFYQVENSNYLRKKANIRLFQQVKEATAVRAEVIVNLNAHKIKKIWFNFKI